MNRHEPTSPIRSSGIAIWIGLAIVATGCSAGCSKFAQVDVDLTIADSSRDENQPAGPIPMTGPTNGPTSSPTIREPYCIEITGSNYRWHVRYPNSEGQFEEQGDGPIARDVHVPLQTDVVLVLKSDDYVYTLALPKYGLKEIAVPKLEFRMAFHSPDEGRFPLLGDQLCGDPHPELQGNLVVEPRDRFLMWLKDQGG